MGKIRGLIGEFDKVKTIKQYANRLSRLDKAVSYAQYITARTCTFFMSFLARWVRLE